MPQSRLVSFEKTTSRNGGPAGSRRIASSGRRSVSSSGSGPPWLCPTMTAGLAMRSSSATPAAYAAAYLRDEFGMNWMQAA